MVNDAAKAKNAVGVRWRGGSNKGGVKGVGERENRTAWNCDSLCDSPGALT